MSNLIKSNFYRSQDQLKTIEAHEINTNHPTQIEELPIEDSKTQQQINDEIEQAQMLKSQIITAAEQSAEQITAQAKLEAEQLKSQALSEIETWWEQRRQQDETIVAESRQSGYQTGLEEGTSTAELNMNEKYEGLMNEAQNILEQSYEMHRRTILDAEIFLLELSCGIAEKIIGNQLDQSMDLVKHMVKQALKRSSEKGVIAICVAPAHYSYIQSVRDELSYLVDPQVELQIYPDASIKDAGCVIKTSFGTIDARVDTQLTEIKHALLDIARRGDESVEQ